MKQELLFLGDEFSLDSNEEIDGSLCQKENSLMNKMVAIGKPFFRGEFGTSFLKEEGKRYVTITDLKLLYMTLSKVRWSKAGNNFQIYLNRAEVCRILDIKNDHNALNRLRWIGEHLAHTSWLKIDIVDKKGRGTDDGFLVKGFRVDTDGKSVVVKLNEDFRYFLEDLTGCKDYLLMWVNDIYGMTMTATYLLYEDLRKHSDSRKVNTRYYTIGELKKVFRIPEKGVGSYMYKKKGRLYFNRNAFENKILIPASLELSECQMIYLKPQILELTIFEDGVIDTKGERNMFFKRVIEGRKVIGYEFQYKIMTKRMIGCLADSEPVRL